MTHIPRPISKEATGGEPVAQKTETTKRDDQKITPDRLPQSSVGKIHSLIWAASTYLGQALITTMVLILIIGWGSFSTNLLIECVTIGLLLRALLYIRGGSTSALGDSGIRRNVRQVGIDEGLFAAGFLAACFIFDWSIRIELAATVALTNFIFQFSVMSMVKMVLAEQRFLDSNSQLSTAQTLLIIGSGELAQQAADRILSQPELATHLIGFLDYQRTGLWRYRDLPLLGHPDQLAELVSDRQVDLVLVAVENDERSQTTELFATAETMGLPVGLLDNLFQPKISKARAVNLAGLPLLLYRSAPENKAQLLIKNILDRIGAALGLIMILPLLALTALLIRLDSQGEIFFKQVRSGLNGKPFKMIKFRTMGSDAEAQKEALVDQNEMSGPVFKIASDPRITAVGRVLRKYSIDELPQLFNVLKGEMSLVGPRPPLPKEVAGMEPWQRRKLSMKPGVTCIWQVSGRNNIDFEEWMRLDLAYIDNWSLWEDSKLIARTIPTVLKGSGS